MSADHIHPEFAVHMLNETGKERATRLAGLFSWLLTEVQAIVPPGRELALVKTKLEEACFFAKKGMAKNPDNQLPTNAVETAMIVGDPSVPPPIAQPVAVPTREPGGATPLTNTEIVGTPEQPK